MDYITNVQKVRGTRPPPPGSTPLQASKCCSATNTEYHLGCYTWEHGSSDLGAVALCCSNNLSTGCVCTACSELVDKLSTACWQLTICYKVVELNRLATDLLFQQLVVVLQFNNDKITALLQLVDKLATSLLRAHLVDKLLGVFTCVV